MSVVFFSGAECGSLSVLEDKWESTTGTVGVQGTVVYTGNYAYYTNTSTNSYLQKTVNFKQLSGAWQCADASGTAVKVIELYDGVTLRAELEVIVSGDTAVLRITGGTGSGVGVDSFSQFSLVLTNSTTLDLKSSSGAIKSTLTIASTTQFSKIRIGHTSIATGYTHYWDDIILSDNITDTIANSRIILRKVKAGTPTYDAFTKVGGATIDLVWADVPYATGTYATAADVDGTGYAQTALINAFSTGGYAATSVDTIVAAKIGLVGKYTSEFEGQRAIRRIVSAATTDTDLSGVVTASDAYYETAFFTATLSALDAMEIGAYLFGISGEDFRVEDEWAQLAYISNSVATGIPIYMAGD